MVYTPTPGIFRKDINPWELLTNFLQGYHSKRLPVIFGQNWFTACFLWFATGRPPLRGKGQSGRVSALFQHSSILQDGASTSSTNAVSAI